MWMPYVNVSEPISEHAFDTYDDAAACLTDLGYKHEKVRWYKGDDSGWEWGWWKRVYDHWVEAEIREC
jgi:hypothetical protein